MPIIYDNIENKLGPALTTSLGVTECADFCVGYFNLRGWRLLDEKIDRWFGGEGHCCRLLVGMQQTPSEELLAYFEDSAKAGRVTPEMVLRYKAELALEFRRQLVIGTPTNEDETGLRRLATQLKAKKVIVRLFVRYPLHAKLYLLHRPKDPVNKRVGYLGSSNLTMAGLAKQGELNVDVMDSDATQKLADWFEERWEGSVDITDELIDVIKDSWAREDLVSPYHVYLKIAHGLSRDAREGQTEFRIPREFDGILFDFQKAAVKIAAHHIQRRNGVLLGDVVGLGKTIMAAAIVKLFQLDLGYRTLIICPKNLEKMWLGVKNQYELHAEVLPLTETQSKLDENFPRYRLVVIDESQNLRNSEGHRYKAVLNYLREQECKVVLLSATPYNKTYLDLANQLRLFIQDETDLGIRPEEYIRTHGEQTLLAKQCPLRSLRAFAESPYPDDWRELMRLYMVRRTRSFIKQNYAATDPVGGRPFLTFSDGTRSYFPERVAKPVLLPSAGESQLARLYAPSVEKVIGDLALPRYGLGNYLKEVGNGTLTDAEQRIIDNLARAGKRLMGFCRVNLFKRLESSGASFLLSLERHVLRNAIFLHAIKHKLDVPIGTQDQEFFGFEGCDQEDVTFDELALFNGKGNGYPVHADVYDFGRSESYFQKRAEEIYALYLNKPTRFKWIRPDLFKKTLQTELANDAAAIRALLSELGAWKAAEDAKLAALIELVKGRHGSEKVLVFTQFADTARYLERQLLAVGITDVGCAYGDSEDPTELARRFSPVSNGVRPGAIPSELRILVATDVLSEGQNLQDAHIIVNYDLPWAIIRLIQRAGRVDRIGQKAAEIICYSFLPAEGVERIIKLRQRITKRLQQNAEVVGTDEIFFENEAKTDERLRNLYTENSHVLDDDEDNEVDLCSLAFQIWQNAIAADPAVEKKVTALPPVVFATRPWAASSTLPGGALVYVKTSEGADALAWVDNEGHSVTESQYAILQSAQCLPDTPALPRQENHHELVKKGPASQ